MVDIEAIKKEFTEIYKENITRDGADKLLDYLTNKCDFFVAPASTRFHGSFEGGLAQHSINVYRCLKDYLERPRVKELYKLKEKGKKNFVITAGHDYNEYSYGYKNDERIEVEGTDFDELYDFYIEKPKEKKGRSFPSRHAYSAFALATLMIYLSIPAAVALFAVAILLCVFRVLLGIHFIRDVITGALVGAFAGVIGLLIIPV